MRAAPSRDTHGRVPRRCPAATGPHQGRPRSQPVATLHLRSRSGSSVAVAGRPDPALGRARTGVAVRPDGSRTRKPQRSHGTLVVQRGESFHLHHGPYLWIQRVSNPQPRTVATRPGAVSPELYRLSYGPWCPALGFNPLPEARRPRGPDMTPHGSGAACFIALRIRAAETMAPGARPTAPIRTLRPAAPLSGRPARHVVQRDRPTPTTGPAARRAHPSPR